MSQFGNPHAEANLPSGFAPAHYHGPMFAGDTRAYGAGWDASLHEHIVERRTAYVRPPRADDPSMLVVCFRDAWRVPVWGASSRRRDIVELIADGRLLLANHPEVRAWAVVPADPTRDTLHVELGEQLQAWLILHGGPDPVHFLTPNGTP